MQSKLHASPKAPKLATLPVRRTGAPSAAVAVAAALIGSGLLALPAIAETGPSAGVRVAYADLDLSREAGAQALLKRIRSAAREACGPEPVVSGLMPRAGHQHRACVNSAVSTAVERINAPVLTALVQPTQQMAAR